MTLGILKKDHIGNSKKVSHLGLKKESHSGLYKKDHTRDFLLSPSILNIRQLKASF